MAVSLLEKAEMHLDYWKKVESGEIKNDLFDCSDKDARSSLKHMIEYFEERVTLLKGNSIVK